MNAIEQKLADLRGNAARSLYDKYQQSAFLNKGDANYQITKFNADGTPTIDPKGYMSGVDGNGNAVQIDALDPGWVTNAPPTTQSLNALTNSGSTGGGTGGSAGGLNASTIIGAAPTGIQALTSFKDKGKNAQAPAAGNTASAQPLTVSNDVTKQFHSAEKDVTAARSLYEDTVAQAALDRSAIPDISQIQATVHRQMLLEAAQAQEQADVLSRQISDLRAQFPQQISSPTTARMYEEQFVDLDQQEALLRNQAYDLKQYGTEFNNRVAIAQNQVAAENARIDSNVNNTLRNLNRDEGRLAELKVQSDYLESIRTAQDPYVKSYQDAMRDPTAAQKLRAANELQIEGAKPNLNADGTGKDAKTIKAINERVAKDMNDFISQRVDSISDEAATQAWIDNYNEYHWDDSAYKDTKAYKEWLGREEPWDDTPPPTPAAAGLIRPSDAELLAQKEQMVGTDDHFGKYNDQFKNTASNLEAQKLGNKIIGAAETKFAMQGALAGVAAFGYFKAFRSMYKDGKFYGSTGGIIGGAMSLVTLGKTLSVMHKAFSAYMGGILGPDGNPIKFIKVLNGINLGQIPGVGGVFKFLHLGGSLHLGSISNFLTSTPGPLR
jgi:hypothetical protein